MTNAFATAFATRIAYETSKQNDALTTENMKRLQSAADFMSHESVAALLASCSVDAETINKTTKADKRFAVYSIDKTRNVLAFVTSSAKLNDMNFYILKTLLKCNAAGVDMSLDDAKAACSAAIKLNKEQKTRVCQNSKHIAESTVKSQHASTLDALLFLNVVSATRDAMNNDTFKFNAENEIAKQIVTRLS